MAGYSQNDPRWAGDALGTSTYWLMGNAQGNARAAGCYVTAGANVLKAFGHDITPGDLNKLATSRGLINSNGDVVRPDWLSVLFPDVLQFVESKNWGDALADLHYFDIRNDLNTEIILEIDDSPSPGMQTHFMRTVGWDGATDVIVDDSWDGIRKGVNAYGARWNPAVHAAAIIYTATKFVRVQPPAPNLNITLDQLTQLYQDLLHRTPDASGISHYVGNYTYAFVEQDIKNSAEYKAIQAKEVPSEPTKPSTPPVVAPPPTKPPETPADPVPVTKTPPVTPITVTPVETLWERFIAWLVKILGIK